MRTHTVSRWLLTAVALIFSAGAAAQVRINEIHYDNDGVDTGEAIEIEGPAGTDLTAYSLVLYNGATASRAPYREEILIGALPATCGARGVMVVTFPNNTVENGSPDGVALIDIFNEVVDFISYEGVFTPASGPAVGHIPTDILAEEGATTPIGNSLQRNAAGIWASGTASFGACNPEPPAVASVTVAPASSSIPVGGTVSLTASAFDIASAPISGTTFTWSSNLPAVASVSSTGVVTAIAAGDAVIRATASNGVFGTSAINVTAAPPPSPVDLHINEIHYDNDGDDTGEAIEIEGPAGTDITGYKLVLYNGNGGAFYDETSLTGSLNASCGTRGVFVENYLPPRSIQNGSPDGIALVDTFGRVLEFLSYEGVFTAANGPAAGRVSINIGASEPSNSPIGNSLQRNSAGVWARGGSSFGDCNPEVPTPVSNTLSFSGRVPTDPELPVGYEDQLFATLRSPSNVTIPTTITWASETPEIASIDQAGVIHALSEGLARFRATATDSTTATYSLRTHVAVASGVTYPGNAEFGEPKDADATDDFIVRHEQFTASYNRNRGGPNWVSYDLDAAHFGAEDRCDCFTMDPDLPAEFPRITTDDYTGSGADAGYPIDRGHMTRSFDRTTGSLDNARTYLFSNVVPQAADVNQGPWAKLENDLGDLARTQDREVYIITGPAGNKGTLKGLGRVVIPASTWKIAVIMAHDQGLANVHDYRDLEVIAVNMPNEPREQGVPEANWNTYRTTVDAIEALTGYDLLALLPDDVEEAVESNTKPPLAAVAGPAGAIAEGSSATFDASSSLDPNGTIASYAWDFGDGSTGSGVSVSHTFTQDGAFTVRVTVTDNDGLTDSATFVLNVTNVAPVVGTVPNATLNVGATYTASGTFTDPGADAWTATVLWGDGSAPEVVPLSGHNFSLTHIYTAGGTYTVTIGIADDDTSVSSTHSVTVEVPVPESGLAAALPIIDNLIATGKIPRGVGILWKAEVIAAQVLIGRGNERAAVQVLKAEVAQIDALVHCRVVKAADVAPLRKVLVDAIASLEGATDVRHRRRH